MSAVISFDGVASSDGRRILVIGAGVNGLTCALCLRRRGFAVTVVADRFAPQVTSVVAGALWEWPPAACGQHINAESLARSKSWCETSYRIFTDLAHDRATGVYVRPATFYFKRPVAEDPRQLQKMNELRTRVERFEHDAGLIARHGVNPGFQLRDAYSHLAPMVDTDVYMEWLLGEVKQAGCRIVQAKIAGPLRSQAPMLLERFEAAAIVHCSGLGAAELVPDKMSPLRGALIRVRNDGKAMPRITQAHCITHDDASDDRGFVFIVPRGEDMLILGGLAEPEEWNLDIGLHNHEPIRAMHRRCVEFLPILKYAEIDAAEPVRVGLRPFRRDNIRVEREPGTAIVHNYGHGGSGITLSWGCAHEVVQLVETMLN